MPNPSGKGFVDCMLLGGGGRPIALVEAKRTCQDPAAGSQQSKLYADLRQKSLKSVRIPALSFLASEYF